MIVCDGLDLPTMIMNNIKWSRTITNVFETTVLIWRVCSTSCEPKTLEMYIEPCEMIMQWFLSWDCLLPLHIWYWETEQERSYTCRGIQIENDLIHEETFKLRGRLKHATCDHPRRPVGILWFCSIYASPSVYACVLHMLQLNSFLPQKFGRPP